MPRYGRILLALTCAAPLTVAAQEPHQTDQDPTVLTIDVETLKADLQEILDRHRIPGASVALVEKDRTIWAGGIGKADVAAGIDVTGDHLFRIGSISKSFTALAVLRAVEDRLLDLETPVRDLAPDLGFTNRWEGSHPITVAMLMEHTTGFDDLHLSEWAVDDPGMTLTEALAFHPDSRVARWRPGTHMSYSNSGPAVAAYVVEKVTGEAFEDYVREQVFDPLGMESSTFHLPRDAARLAQGYESDGVSEVPYGHIFMRPSGNLHSSSREMASYLRTMINRGTLDGVRLLSPETITRMETPATTLAGRAGLTSYGYGLGNRTSIVNGHLFHGHNGVLPGFRSRSAYSPDLGVGFFVSINKLSSAMPEIAKLLGERLTEGFEKPPGTVAELSDEELRAMTGSYHYLTPRHQLIDGLERLFFIRRITLEEGKLFILPLVGGGRELIPVTAASFRYEDEPVATVFRVVDDEGNPVLQVGREGNFGRVRQSWAIFQPAATAATLLLLISALLFAPVWAAARIFGRMKTISLRIVLLPLLATVSIFIWFVLPPGASVQDLGTISGWSLTWFLGSLVFAALTALSLHASFRSSSVETGRFVRLHSRLVSLACAVVLLYSLNNGWIGLRMWAY